MKREARPDDLLEELPDGSSEGVPDDVLDSVSESLPLPKRPLSTKLGWADHVSKPTLQKPSLTDAGRYGYDASGRQRFDDLRCAYHSSFGPLFTSTMGEIRQSLMDRVDINIEAPQGACPGAVIDGLPNVGKSTILTDFGRLCELRLRRKYEKGLRKAGIAEWIPVVYLTLRARTTIKGLNTAIANFYGAPYARIPRYDATADRLTDMVLWCAQECNTKVFLIDDIHYLKLSNESDRLVNNHLKELMNHTSATFVYAGVGCRKTGLFTEGHPKDEVAWGQTRGRFAYFPIEPFDVETPLGKSEWVNIVGAFENHLVLKNARKGMLIGLAPYLYERTGGFLGSLSSLVRLAANKAIRTGEEEITRGLLGRIQIDYAAETEWERRKKEGEDDL